MHSTRPAAPAATALLAAALAVLLFGLILLLALLIARRPAPAPVSPTAAQAAYPPPVAGTPSPAAVVVPSPYPPPEPYAYRLPIPYPFPYQTQVPEPTLTAMQQTQEAWWTAQPTPVLEPTHSPAELTAWIQDYKDGSDISLAAHGQTMTFTLYSRFWVFLDDYDYPVRLLDCEPEWAIGYISNGSLRGPDKYPVYFEATRLGGCRLTNRDFGVNIVVVDPASPGYPPPPSPTTWTPAELTVQAATSIAVQTAWGPSQTPGPLPTNTPLPDGRSCYVDGLNNFSLLLPPGWRAHPPPLGAGAAHTILYNYDPEPFGAEGDFAPGTIKVQLIVDHLTLGQTFDQYLAGRISLYASAFAGSIRVSPPVPYALGNYQGVSFELSGGYGPRALEIILQDGARLAIIGLIPLNSSAFGEAVAMLASLDMLDAACPPGLY